MSPDEVAAAIRRLIAEQDAEMAALVALKPAVVDAHSDGRRVRYVRAEEQRKTLAAVLEMLEPSSS